MDYDNDWFLNCITKLTMAYEVSIPPIRIVRVWDYAEQPTEHPVFWKLVGFLTASVVSAAGWVGVFFVARHFLR